MPKKPTSKASKTTKPQKQQPLPRFVYTGPPLPEDQRQKLKDALKLPPRLPELDRSVLTKLDHAAPSSRVRKSGAGGRPRLLSERQKKKAATKLRRLLKEDPHRWSQQRTAAKYLAVYVGLPETAWQTLAAQVVVPELEQWRKK